MIQQIFKEALWSQFGASIDMLENAINAWHEDRWTTEKKFFYNAYHCLIFLDYYLTIPAPKVFESSLPFNAVDREDVPEDVVGDLVPAKIYSKKQLLEYLSQSREKCRKVIDELNDTTWSDRWIEEDGDMNYSIPEILLYNMRHVQHHTAQLNLILRQQLNEGSEWVSRVG